MTDMSEWDGTPWAGSVIEPYVPKNLWTPDAIKSASGPGVTAMLNDVPLMSIFNTPQKRMAAYLRAYKVGWFYKAESKISTDIAAMKVTVAHEDDAGANEATIIEPDLFTPWERLDPIGQFLRLMERPNPYQSGRVLRAKTQIRIDMAGSAFWYLEGVGAGFRTPSAIYGISPSRMYPSTDSQGVLIGWVMDRDRPGGGIPFEAHEILPFMSASADDEPWGVGVVEAVYGELPLSELLSRHQADLLTTGGRLAGMLWPKNRTLDESEFLEAQKAWRNVSSDPNAARRLLIFPEPMEYAVGASTPKEIGIPDLSALNRDNILTAFPISPYQLGVPMPGGLNSAETRREDRRDYHEGTLHPRVELLEEVIQIGLLSRYEELLGTTYDFDIEEPNLDDAPRLIEKSAAMKALISLGFDDKAAVEAVGLDHIKYNGPPAPPPMLAGALPDPTLTVNEADSSRRGSQVSIQEPVVKSVEKQRNDLVSTAQKRAKGNVRSFLSHQQDRLIDFIKAAMPSTKAGRKAVQPDDWWNAAEEDAALQGALRGLYVEVARGGLQAVADNLGRFVGANQIDGVISDLLSYGGSRISDINAKTRDALQQTLTLGTQRGYSLPQLIDGVPDEGFAGVKGTVLDNGVAAFDEYRAEMIARTETTLSYNRSAVTGYGSFGVQQLQAYDGDGDPECADRLLNNPYSIEDAMGIEDHPNGTLVWSPIVGEKAWEPDREARIIELATKALDRPQPL